MERNSKDGTGKQDQMTVPTIQSRTSRYGRGTERGFAAIFFFYR